MLRIFIFAFLFFPFIAQAQLHPAIAEQRIAEAAAAFEGQDFGQAAQLFREIVALEPQNALAWHFLGQSLANIGDKTGALEAYGRVFDIQPTGQVADQTRKFISMILWRPQRPLRLVCSSGPGSALDVMTRVIAKLTGDLLGQPVVVENKIGEGGGIAMEYLLNLPPDGYTIMSTTHNVTRLLVTTPGPLSVDHFRYVSRMASNPLAVVVRQDSPIKTLQDLVDRAKSNPGMITIGGFGTASVAEKLVLDLGQASGVDLKYNSFQNIAQTLEAVLNGNIDLIVSTPDLVSQHINSGRLSVLALATEGRLSQYANVPTFTDLGYPIVAEQWYGVMVAKQVPNEVIASLNMTMRLIANHPEFVQFLGKSNSYPGYMPEADFTKLVYQQTGQ